MKVHGAERVESVALAGWRAFPIPRALSATLRAVVLAAAGTYLFAPAVTSLWHVWWGSDTHSYGPLVPIVSAVFAWQKRAELRAIRPNPSAWGIGAAAVAVVSFHVGDLGKVLGLQALALPVYVTAVVLTIWGKAACRVLAFPLMFLFFVVPVPAALLDRIAYPLQVFAARFAGEVLDWAGIPVIVDNILIRLPHLTLKVAVACAGLRYLVNITLVGVVVAYWTQRTTARRLFLACLALPIAILANATRVAVTGLLGHHFGGELAEGFFHNVSGTIMFWFTAGIVVLAGIILRRVKP